MGEAKQVPLNGSYYGPSIPPQRASHQHGRRGSSHGCGPCCLLTFLIKVIATTIIVAAIAAFFFWLLVRPSRVKFVVEKASLAQFNLTDAGMLRYNLSLYISVRNPNRRIGIIYDRLEARAYYQGERFDYVALPDFYQGHKNTTVLHPMFKGQSPLALGGSAVDDFNKEKRKGIFGVDVKIYARVRLKVGPFKTIRYKPHIDCELKLPLTTSTAAAANFTRTKCDIGL